MVRVLVVDDSAMDRRLAGGFLKRAGMDPSYADHGAQALASIADGVPDIVVTDLQMPEMDGLELVEAIRKAHPSLPVVLMTAHGSEDIAVQALRRGAASYVPKRNLAQDLVPTLRQILEVASRGRREQHLLASLVSTESRLSIDNDLASIPAVVGHLEEGLARMRLCDETGRLQVAVALREALVNAICHGNLEVSSALLDQAAGHEGPAFDELVQRRRHELPYRERRVRLTAIETQEAATYVIVDEGPGFDPASLPDPTDLANLEKPSGRGLLLIRTFMDEVRHNDRGNQITMVFRRKEPGEDDGPLSEGTPI